jgi:general secretion pathway protein L
MPQLFCPEELHFALGPAIGDEPRLVAAVSNRLMSHWRSWLAQFGVTTEVMVPDFLALPIPSAIADGDVALVRTARTAFTIERDMLPAMTDVQDAVPQELAPESLIALFHRTLLMAPCLNLLQGPYAAVRSWSLPSAWRRAAILAGVAVGLAAAGQIAAGWRLNAEAEAASARAEAVLRAAMPEVKRVVNPRAQIRAHLQEMRAGSSNTFLRLCQLTFPAVQQVEGAEIQALRYDGRRSELAATVALPSFEAIERIKTELAGKGLVLQEGGARQDGTRILAELIVKLS